jgi:hypothetical protein
MKTINGGIKGKNINTWIGSRLATKRLTARLKYLYSSPVHILVDLAGVVVSIDGKMAASDGGDNSTGCHVIDQTKSHMNKPY